MDVFAASFQIEDAFSPASRFSVFGQLASDIIGWLTIVAAAIAFMFILIAGVKIVTSSGDQKKLASAQATLTYAIIGLAVTVLAFVIVRVVQFFLRANIPIT